MRITQGTFSFLPDFTDEQIEAQMRYAVSHGWSLSIEYTDDPHPRNAYWEMWGLPHFDLPPGEIETVMREVRAAREAYPEAYIKVIAYDATYGRQTSAMSFIVNRPSEEHGFDLERYEDRDRVIRYRLRHKLAATGSVELGNQAMRGADPNTVGA
jgi:ribulose-bisphosphate carboxylase small chain